MPDFRCPDCRSRLVLVSMRPTRLHLRIEHDPTCPALSAAGGPQTLTVRVPKEKKS